MSTAAPLLRERLGADAIDATNVYRYSAAGVLPACVLQPATIAEVVDAVGAARGAGLAVIPVGQGTHLDIGHPPRRYDAALDSLSHAEGLKFQGPPELARSARLHLALVLTKSGSFERAITVLTELTLLHKKAPDSAVAAGIAGLRQPWLPFEVPEASRDLVFQLGDAMASAMEKDYKEATQKFEAALQQYPQEPNVHFRFGAFLNIQDSARGVEEIRKAVELAPDHVPALVGLTVMSLKREELDTALEYGERAVKAGPGDFSTHIALGRALLAKENPARAAAELEMAVKLAPASPEARFSLASAYSRLGRKEESARELTEFKRLQRLEK